MTCIRGAEPMWLTWFPVREQILEPSCRDGIVLVDVGGGVGHDIIAYKRHFAPSGRLILQDLPDVLKDAQLAESEGIERVEHDFFTPQTIKGSLFTSSFPRVNPSRRTRILLRTHPT